MKKVGIIGATGYAGAELVRLLLGHASVKLTKISSVSYEGQTFSQIYPQLAGFCDNKLCNEAEVLEDCDIVFAALPNGLSEPLAKICLESGKLFVDLGADFRLDSEASYEKWYGKKYDFPAIHQQSVYALPELFPEEIKKAQIIGNPGCYPTSAALGLAPALEEKLINLGTIVIDAKSGATGSGRGLSISSHFTELNEGFAPYKIGAHRHTPEIEQTLSHLAGQAVKITFVPHLLPINRGIVSTIYADLLPEKRELTPADITELYKQRYNNCKFVRVMNSGETANLKNVRCSNFCDISIHKDEHTGKLIIISVIDNMVKGAAGQAVQNMNLSQGFAEDEGLKLLPPMF